MVLFIKICSYISIEWRHTTACSKNVSGCNDVSVYSTQFAALVLHFLCARRKSIVRKTLGARLKS